MLAGGAHTQNPTMVYESFVSCKVKADELHMARVEIELSIVILARKFYGHFIANMNELMDVLGLSVTQATNTLMLTL